MAPPLISVRGLGKSYRLGQRGGVATLREELARLFTRPRPGVPAPAGAAPATARTDAHGDFWALRDVEFDVGEGEVLGIIGHNGAGKSTLLKILARITEPTCGEARLRGCVSSLLEVGTGFHHELTGRENVYLNGAILGMTRREIRQKFDEIVAFAEVEAFIDTPVKRYSSGMYVRLAFAVAAHLEPAILLLDEVLAVGDAQFQQRCFAKMDAISHQGRAILLVSHSLASVVNLCQRAVLLDGGRVVSMGPARDVVQHYIAGQRSAPGEQRWPDAATAPQHGPARLCSVRVRQPGQPGPTADVDIAQEIHLEITWAVTVAGSRVYAWCILLDHRGTAVLASSNSVGFNQLDDPWFQQPLPVGQYRTTCRLPATFLNDGLYSISVGLNEFPLTSLVNVPHAVSFRVHDTGEMRQLDRGPVPGVVRPQLPWQTTPLAPGEDDSARRP